MTETRNVANLKDEKEIRRRCSDILHEFFDMVNSRQLNPDHAFWIENISPNYTYTGLHGNFSFYEPIDLKNQLRQLEALYLTESPNFELIIIHLDTERESSDLRTYMQYDIRDSPEGLTRQSAAQIKWSLDDGKLKILEVQTMAGAAL
ncbi:hypothetical protein M409DRAFT_57405 [Zasmidium cellare ATCC 36951]|uniref:SnoaL-like domain-containing protein n=1 Tax=Zasmidium cellare ATCC 36951 TaxID=1080233 RepID=A0A6A6C9L6_ZASCE|nr:uncharacterized protein M409DRAFT_57405 [Zasmidium cellare ATCC 36951]KAF2163513.1 hypothetical protein M409DRAFT_57405 [Zasmidium cellare ATCC 36951]